MLVRDGVGEVGAARVNGGMQLGLRAAVAQRPGLCSLAALEASSHHPQMSEK